MNGSVLNVQNPPVITSAAIATAYRRERLSMTSGSDLRGPMLPTSAESDPERQRDEPRVQPEALPLCVDAIKPELVPAPNVARRVNLSDAGESRPNLLTLCVSGHILERDQLSVRC